jgi:hypothetical protein
LFARTVGHSCAVVYVLGSETEALTFTEHGVDATPVGARSGRNLRRGTAGQPRLRAQTDRLST